MLKYIIVDVEGFRSRFRQGSEEGSGFLGL